MTQFSDLGLSRPILDALSSEGYASPSPIQAQAIPHVLAGHDLFGIAATGTGKTAAFALPILDRLAAARRTGSRPRGSCRALVLSPTRELAAQIGERFRAYGRNLGVRVAVIVGGVPFKPQANALAGGVDVLVATPGRLLDHLAQGTARLDLTEVLVLDEADHMLDLGFIPAVRKLIGHLPRRRQSLLFSATMPGPIKALAAEYLRAPQTVSVSPPDTPAARIDQSLIHVGHGRKAGLLAEILRAHDRGRVLVFTRTKRGADRVVRGLAASRLPAAAIHGNKNQNQRTLALDAFRAGHTPILVATDIAARGIDVHDIALVVNFDLPNVPETYIHRIGRTARAGAAGSAVSFCGPDEQAQLRAIEALIRVRIPARSDEAGRGASRPDARAIAARPAAKAATRRDQPIRAAGEGTTMADLPFMRASTDRNRASRRRRRDRPATSRPDNRPRASIA